MLSQRFISGSVHTCNIYSVDMPGGRPRAPSRHGIADSNKPVSLTCTSWSGPTIRVLIFALLEKPADDTSPRCIDCYLVEAQEFAVPADLPAEGDKFKLDPECVLFSLERLHNAKPPDFHLRALSDPRIWFGAVASMLIGELRQRCPHLFEGLDLPPLRDPSSALH